MIAPQLLMYEVVNGAATAARRNRVAVAKATEAISNLVALGIELREVEPLQMFKAALRYNLAAYDAAYLALAETEKCVLWTGDRAFYQTVREESHPVKWIGDYGKKGH